MKTKEKMSEKEAEQAVANEKAKGEELDSNMAPNNENVDMLNEEDAAKVKFTKGDDTKVNLVALMSNWPF